LFPNLNLSALFPESHRFRWGRPSSSERGSSSMNWNASVRETARLIA